jgi:glycerol-3-phosphate dehydrogenase
MTGAAFPLRRNVAALNGPAYDLLVIGGGIYGAWTAYDAALRGLKVALIEKTDWGSGTSQASSKLIHGGLRYLEHYEFSLVRHALNERRTLAQLAPHLVRPMNFVIPVWRGARVGRLKWFAGLTLYDLLATGQQPVARFRSLSRKQLSAAHPYLLHSALRGGLRYGDCQEDDARMTLFVVAAAQAAGAVCANAVSATALLRENGRCVGAELRDQETGARFALRAACVVNAAGPWARPLAATIVDTTDLPPVKLIRGLHLVLPAIPGLDHAFLLTAPDDGRVFFVIPWYGRTLVGTTETAVLAADAVIDDEPETHYLLSAVNALLPGLGWRREDVLSRFAGVRSLLDTASSNLSATSREFSVHRPLPGLILPLGGKYTTARLDAAQLVEQIFADLNRPLPPCRSADQPLPGAPTDFRHWQPDAIAALHSQGVDALCAAQLTQRHGTGIARIAELLRENPAWRQRLHPAAPFIAAEAVLAVRDEMARTVEDVIRRRMPLRLVAGTPGPEMDFLHSLLPNKG